MVSFSASLRFTCVLWIAGVLVCSSTTASMSGCARTPVLANTHQTPQAVAEAVVAALNAGDSAALLALAVTEAEFRDVVWPKLPAARPERNLTWQYVWGDLHAKSRQQAAALMGAWQEGRYTFVDVGLDGKVDDHGTYRVHRDSRVELLTPQGHAVSQRLFGSVIEQQGQYKVFSFVVD